MRFLLCLIASGVLLSSCTEKKSPWATYTSAEGGFKIFMPQELVKSNKQIGKKTTHFVTWKPSSFAIDKFKLFQVSYTDCNECIGASPVTLNRILDSSIKLRKNDFTELKDIDADSISLNGNPGRAFIYAEPKINTIAIVKECIANNRIYDLTVVAKKDYPTNTEINNFFNSFQILR